MASKYICDSLDIFFRERKKFFGVLTADSDTVFGMIRVDEVFPIGKERIRFPARYNTG